MKKASLVLTAAVVFFPAISFAQVTVPQTSPKANTHAAVAQDPWVLFLRHQDEERSAFNKQLKEEKDTFLSGHPDVAARLAAAQKAAQERAQQRRQAGRGTGSAGLKVPHAPMHASAPAAATAPVSAPVK